jgi:hypothetical protein
MILRDCKVFTFDPKTSPHPQPFSLREKGEDKKFFMVPLSLWERDKG